MRKQSGLLLPSHLCAKQIPLDKLWLRERIPNPGCRSVDGDSGFSDKCVVHDGEISSLEHPVVVQGIFRHSLPYIPQLDDAIALETE